MPRKNKGTTHKEKVLKYLQKGKAITPRIAVALFDCWRLADVIYKLRKDGYKITKTIPKGRVHAEYKMVMK